MSFWVGVAVFTAALHVGLILTEPWIEDSDGSAN